MFRAFVICFIILIQPSYSSQEDIYQFDWLDPDKEVYVLQNRKFRKDSRLYLAVNGTKTLSGAFFDAYGFGVRGGFFFTEDWGLELAYESHSGSTNNNYEGVDDQSATAFYRTIDNYVSANILWSPFYAKINTFNKIFYYDWIFGVGLANVTTSDNRNEFGVDESDTLKTESVTGASWTTGFRFYLSETVSLRVDLNALHFQANLAEQDETNDDDLKVVWFHNYDLGLGLNFTF